MPTSVMPLLFELSGALLSSSIRLAMTATVLKHEDVNFNEAIIMLLVNPTPSDSYNKSL
jgi:hypothetical protein